MLERFVGPSLPRAHVGHGMFYYAFPGLGRQTVITAHDLSLFHEEFHPRGEPAASAKTLARDASALSCGRPRQ